MRKKALHLCMITVACALVLSGRAAAAGLGNFADVRSYRPGVFSDIASSDWFVSGVRAAYQKEIMDGVGGGRFHPQGTVSRAEAVTIAARIHAAYTGQIIPQAAGAWHQPYYEYAKTVQMLPASVTDAAGLTATADRGFIAYVFSRAVDATDLPEVNLAASIPDLAEIPAEYGDAAVRLYRGGVLTGKDGGKFDSTGLATRAEIATVVMRLLEPSERVSSDPKLDPMYTYQNQQLNSFNLSRVYQLRDGYVVVEGEGNRDGMTTRKLLVRRGGTERVFEVPARTKSYYIGIYQLWYYGDKLYAASVDDEDTSFYSLNLDTGECTTVLTFPKTTAAREWFEIRDAVAYDGTLYILVMERHEGYRSNKAVIYAYKGGGTCERVGEFEPLFGEGGMPHRMTVFDGKFIVTFTESFDYFSDVYLYDPETGEAEQLLRNLEYVTISGNTLFYQESYDYNWKTFDLHIFRMSLSALAYPKEIGKTEEPISGITAWNGEVYFTTSSGLYRIGRDGSLEQVASPRSAGSLGILDNSVLLIGANTRAGDAVALDGTFARQAYYNWRSAGTTPPDFRTLNSESITVEVNHTHVLLTSPASTTTWVVSDPLIATVKDGLVTGRLPGVTTVRARVEETGQEIFCPVTVPEPNDGGTAKPPPVTQPGRALSAQELFYRCSNAVFYVEVRNDKGELAGTASGFFIDQYGTAVTNYHVVKGSSNFTAILADGSVAAFRVLATDPEHDLALVKVAVSSSAFLPIGDSSALAVGQTAYAIGSPLGLENSITDGLISNPARDLGDGVKLIQISVPIAPGSSGGALLNEYGQVIGVTSSGFQFAQSLNFAIPIADLFPLFEQLED